MTLPAHVAEQENRADALLQAMNAQPENAATEQQQEAGQPEEAQTAAQPTIEAKPQGGPADWEHKYRVLQGMFNSQVPALQREVGELRQQLAAAAKQAPADEEPAPQKSLAETLNLDPKDVEEFGPGLTEFVRKVVAQAASQHRAAASQASAPVEQITQELQRTQAQVQFQAEERFFDRMAQAVPQWEQINGDAGFVQWLQEVDPITRTTRQQALHRARETLDAGWAADIFQQYARGLTERKTAARPEVEKQVTPRTGSSPAPVDASSKKVWTTREVEAAYAADRRGEYRGRDQEWARVEADINLALAEGRIR